MSLPIPNSSGVHTNPPTRGNHIRSRRPMRTVIARTRADRLVSTPSSNSALPPASDRGPLWSIFCRSEDPAITCSRGPTRATGSDVPSVTQPHRVVLLSLDGLDTPNQPQDTSRPDHHQVLPRPRQHLGRSA